MVKFAVSGPFGRRQTRARVALGIGLEQLGLRLLRRATGQLRVGIAARHRNRCGDRDGCNNPGHSSRRQRHQEKGNQLYTSAAICQAVVRPGVGADDSRPLAHAPLRHETVRHIRIARRECFRGGRRCALEQQDGPVDRIRERPAQHSSLPRATVALAWARWSFRNGVRSGVVVDDVVEEEVMRRRDILTREILRGWRFNEAGDKLCR